MVMTASRERNLRPLLLALALLFAAATVVYSVAWMYYVRLSSLPVEVGMDTQPSSPGMIITKVWKDAPAERAGLRSSRGGRQERGNVSEERGTEEMQQVSPRFAGLAN